MTSSFVTKVLEHAGQVEQKAVHEQLDVLTMKLSEMEVELHQLVDSKYVRFHPNYFTAHSLIHRVNDVHKEVSDMENKCNNEIRGQLSLSTGDFHNLSQELSKARTFLRGLTYLADVYGLLETCARSLEGKKYSEAALALMALDAYWKQPLTDQDDDKKITILAAMKIEFKVQFARLECDLSDLWTDLVKWTVKTSPNSDKGAAALEVSVSVTCDGDGESELEELVEGLHVSSLLVGRMKTFADWFQKYLVPFVTDNLQLRIAVKTSKQTRTLHITRQDKQPVLKMGDTKSKDVSKNIAEEKMYTYVFANLMDILDNMHTLFLHIQYGRHHITKLDVSSASNSSESLPPSGSHQGTLMSLLGQTVAPSLLDLLQKTVLAKAVPRSAKDLEGFNEVIIATQLLQERLLKLGFIQPDNRSLLDHVQNINMLFANKKSQATLEEAHSLLTSDLHDTVAVAEDKPIGEWPPLTRGGVKKGKRPELCADRQLSDNSLRMPKCRISENIQTLMRLAYETLSEATDSPPDTATQMFLAVRSMFELYYHVVPTYHAHTFETVPQVSALHHNNCMFISHHLLTLGHQYAQKLPSPENKTFVDLIQKIRQSGVHVLMAQINRQRCLLVEYLNGAEGFGNMEDESNFYKADRVVRQVMLQLGHLQKVWKPVLPINIYKKAMGKLIEMVVVTISDSVSSLEDIAQDAAHKLAALLAPMEQECGELVTSPGEVAAAELMRHVARWSRLTELKFILGASLSEIADRWSDGSGPLALSFTPAEVKQLIRSLFQNTDRRANLLATIKTEEQSTNKWLPFQQ